MEGFSERIILLSSSVIRSFETILIRSACLVMAAKVSSSILKLSWEAKRIARIMRNGSSEKVTSDQAGVRISLLSSRQVRRKDRSVRRNVPY